MEGDVSAVRKLLEEGWSVHEPTDEGESLLSLACSAGTQFGGFICSVIKSAMCFELTSLYTICQCGILLVYLKFDEVHVHQKSIVADN